MKKLFNRLVALTVATVLLMSAVYIAYPIVSAADEAVYKKSMDIPNPYSVSDLDGDASKVKFAVAANLDSAFPGTDHKRIWWNTFVGDPTNWTDGSIKADTSIPLAGYNIQKADGTMGASGEVVYRSFSAISEIRFDTSYSVKDDYWIAKPLEFFASSDGKKYKKIETTRKTVGDEFTRKDVCDGMYAQIYDTYSFKESEDIHFVKVVSTINYENPFSKQINRIYGIDYNCYGKEITYSKSVKIAKPYAICDQSGESSTVKFGIANYIGGAAPGVTDNRRVWWGDFYGNTSGWDGVDDSVPLIGYNIQKADGSAGSSGYVVYKFSDAVKDVRFDTSYSTNGDFWLAKAFEFYASSNGKTYTKIATERTKAGVELTHSGFLGINSQIYDCCSFTEGEDIRFVKIVSTLKTDNEYTKYINRIYGIDYNLFNAAEHIVTRYENEVIITPDSKDITIEGDGGAVLDSPKRFNGGWGPYHIYTFHSGPISSEARTENNASGSVIVESSNQNAITDWCFGGVCSSDPSWSGAFSFFASTDGESWDEIEYDEVQGKSYVEAWNAQEYEYKGTLDSSAGYKFIKITASAGNFAFLPAYRYLLYSTSGFDGDNLQPAESYTNRMEEKNYFEKNSDYYLFRTGSPAHEFDIHVNEPVSSSPAVSVLVSADGDETETDYLKTAFRVLVKNNGDGTGEYRYYNSFYKSRNITNIKITLNRAELLYIDYNLISGLEDTERRHYDDVPIGDPIEDLDLKYVVSEFYKGNQNGIAMINNANLHNNGSDETAAFIGGKCGFLSAMGQRDYSIIMETSYVRDFKFRYAFSSDSSAKIRQLKAYAISEWDGEETEIPLMRYLDENYKSAGYKNYIFRPSDRSKLQKNEYYWIKIEVLCETYTDYSELLEFTYFYDVPEIEGMAPLKDNSPGLLKMRDSFDVPMLLTDNGGKATDLSNMKWVSYNLGFNGADNVIMQDIYGADSYIVYNCDDLKEFEVRGYKAKGCQFDLEFEISADGENWTPVKPEYYEKELLSNWKGVSYSVNNGAVPNNSNYLKILINPDAMGDEIMISDVQVFYTGKKTAGQADDTDSDGEATDDSDSGITEEPEEEISDMYSGTSITENAPKGIRKKLIIYRRIKPAVLVVGGCLAFLLAALIAVTVIIVIKKKKGTLKPLKIKQKK